LTGASGHAELKSPAPRTPCLLMSHVAHACAWLPPSPDLREEAMPWGVALACKLCEESYGEDEPRMPVVLACGHTFCRECLEGWAAKSDIVLVAADGGGSGVSCPTCRTVCSVAVEDLPINYGVLDGAVTLCRCNLVDAVFRHRKPRVNVLTLWV
jgi:hypothetical protein